MLYAYRMTNRIYNSPSDDTQIKQISCCVIYLIVRALKVKYAPNTSSSQHMAIFQSTIYRDKLNDIIEWNIYSPKASMLYWKI